MSIWTNRLRHPIDFLLMESADLLLLESGFFIILEQTGSADGLWTFRTKN